MSKRKLLIVAATALFISAIVAFGIFYMYKKSELNKQLAKVNNQLQELPELEKDIFTKCMEGKEGTAQNIAFCQENTQTHIHTLAQDLANAKKDLKSKTLLEVLQ